MAQYLYLCPLQELFLIKIDTISQYSRYPAKLEKYQDLFLIYLMIID